jgi:hypothetical protein
MPQECSVCIHPQRAQIDRKLVERVPLRTIQSAHGGTTASSLQRHKRGHLAQSLTRAAEAKEVTRADSLLERIEELISTCKSIAEQANKAKQWQSACAALRECRCNLALLGELSGELRRGNGVNVGVTVNNLPQDHESLYRKMLELMSENLAKYPDFLAAVRGIIARIDERSTESETSQLLD